MGKKGYNWKARQAVETKVDDSETQKIQIEGIVPAKEYGVDDPSNALVLPSSKRHTKVKKEFGNNVKILSKQQRKRLEKIVEKKKKKENRASLLEALSKVQLKPEELSQMTSISAVQSKGLKKNLRITEFEVDPVALDVQIAPAPETNQTQRIRSIAGARKRKHLLSLEPGNKNKKQKKDPNVVGLEESSSGSSVSDISDNEEQKINQIEDPNIEQDETNEESIAQPISEVSKDVEIIENEPDSVKITELDFKPKRNRNRKEKKIVVPVVSKIHVEKTETVFVEVDRDPKIQAARLKLPILGEEQVVVECINNNAIVLIAGETGSGKTTQVPQFLYEAGYARNNKMIGITEPRRVAAVAMAERVGKEMSLPNSRVSYLMRFEGNVTEETQIKFMTDGVLLKEVETDFTLSRYSVIIIDEAHERSVFTDILIGLLSRIVPLRCRRGDPLRLVIMSATLRVEDFTENSRLFRSPPPVVKIESRQFPVTIHFNKRTEEDYMKAAFSKTIKIHTKLPEGGILVFVTGQQEVNTLVKRLRLAFPYNKGNTKEDKSKKESKIKSRRRKLKKEKEEEEKCNGEGASGEEKKVVTLSSEEDADDECDEVEMRKTLKKVKEVARLQRKKQPVTLPKVNLDDFDLPDDEVQDDLIENGDDEESDIMEDSEDENEWGAIAMAGALSGAGPLWVLPLYSMLPPSQQARVFQDVPEGCRLCVVATNVAETSLTIPNIKYVVDTGKQKTRVYEKMTGASAMRVVWSAQSAALQRAGRAGRTSPGHCYRLYSSAVYQHDMPADREPEIRTRPVDQLLLQMKCMGIDKVINFPFPSAPDIMQLKAAEARLKILGALDNPPVSKVAGKKASDEEVLKVTPLGKAISAYPVLPRYGKMLALSHQHDLFQYTVCMVAALSVQEVLIGQKKKWLAVGEELLLGDPGALLTIVGAAEHAALNGRDLESWCESQGVRARALKEVRQLRAQLARGAPGPEGPPPVPRKPPGALARPLRQLLLAGLGDSVARKVCIEDVKQSQDKIRLKYAYHCAEMEEPAFMHSSSVLRKQLPEWVVYQEVYEAGEGEHAKMIMRGVTAIEPEWLPVYVPKLCNLGEPLSDPPPRYDQKSDKVLCHVNATFSKNGWQLPTVEIDFPKSHDIYRWFAVFFLDGSVCEKFKKYTPSLLSPPLTMIKSWAKLQPRTEFMHRTLATKRICSKSMLLEEWKSSPSFLLDAILKWLPESAHNEISLFWPPVDK